MEIKMEYKVEILKAFLENKELVQSMKNCDHGNTDLGTYNDYHMCGSVWTHTMMVYQQAHTNDFIELIMALCHDIGKVIVRKVKEDGKVTFYGHADAPIQPTIDFVMYLKEKGILTDDKVFDFMRFGLSPMANHMVYYQNYSSKSLFTAGANSYIGHYYDRMEYMDGNGSICKSGKIEDAQDIKLKDYIPKLWDYSKPVIYIWTGLPGSGKDYLSEMNGYDIISFDDIRLEVY